MQIDKLIEISMLFDFYGALLTEKQKEICSLYHEDNLSLGEIAGELCISRQGVHEALKKAEKLLYQYEEKLGLIEKFSKKEEAISYLEEKIALLITKNHGHEELIESLSEMKRIIDELDG